MPYALTGSAKTEELERLSEEMRGALDAAGFAEGGELVLNLVDAEAPRPFRRKSKGTFVAALYELDERPDDVLAATYPMLVRALANVVLAYVPSEEEVWFTTMERGTYAVTGDDVPDLAREVVGRLEPLAHSKLVIENEFHADLEQELWEGDAITRSVRDAGVRMGDLDLLPAPFPIEQWLSERELRHVKRLYGIGGLSYGNLSARKDETRFWMSASGVDKTRLEIPGRDILLVSGYDPDDAKIVLSIPPNVEPRRVSVDAIEHWMIYQAHPGVGAILHVHAWMQGIAATDVNYPCGTEELANAVSDLLAREPDPDHAVIGLRNHGITATGESLEEILDRIEPKILRQVPMT